MYNGINRTAQNAEYDAKEGERMHKKLRLRFLLICWGLLSALMIAFAVGIGMYLYHAAVRGTEDALKNAAETGELNDESRGMAMLDIDGHGVILSVRTAHLNISEERLYQILAEANTKDDDTIESIEMEKVRYRYIYDRFAGNAKMYLAECSQELSLLHTLRFSVPLFAVLGAALLFPVSILLAHWVSRPIENAWEKQSDFVSDATHELKTPLTVIATNTEAVLSNPEATIESQERWLDSIQGETSRMADLVAKLLFLAKIDAGEIRPDCTDFPLSEDIEGMCMERESKMFEEGRTLEYEMTPDLNYYGDRQRIQQMMNEMLDNAEQYTPVGGMVRVVVNHDRRQNVRVVISNTGKQLTEEQLSKLFDRFYRVDPSRSRETGGYGLGLCVARSIAVIHGGDVTAESKNGVNVFTITLGKAVRDSDENI